MNLVEHRKQLQGSCLTISDVLSFAPKEGSQDFGLEELNQDVNDNETSYPIHEEEQSKLSSEDAAKHGPILRNLCSETHMLGVNWDDISWQHRENWSKENREPELLVTANVCSVANNDEMLQQSNCIQNIPVNDFEEPEECSMSTKHVFEKHHMKNSQHFPVQSCYVPNCPTPEIIPINSGKIDGTSKELKDQQEDCSERFLEAEDVIEDFFDKKTKYSKETTDIHIMCGNTEHSEELSADQHDNFLLERGIGNTKEIYRESSVAKFTSEDVCGVLVLSNSSKKAKMEDKNDGQDHNGHKQRKRYCLDDLIADVIMAECQFHQKALFHFDLEPLSSSLAAHIYSFYHRECITTIHFKQLLEASKGMIDHGDGMVTEQRYYMALLSLAHQQNIGTFKGPVIGGYQFHLQANSSCSLNEIMIHLEPLLKRQDG